MHSEVNFRAAPEEYPELGRTCLVAEKIIFHLLAVAVEILHYETDSGKARIETIPDSIAIGVDPCKGIGIPATVNEYSLPVRRRQWSSCTHIGVYRKREQGRRCYCQQNPRATIR